MINGVIERKLALLDSQVVKLERHLEGVSYEVFKDDWVLTSMAERALQVAVEIIIDVAERLLAQRGAGPAATSVEAIEKCVDLGIVKSREPYSNMVRFRNLLVHGYEEIDPAMTYQIVREHLDDFRRFREEVDRYLTDAS